MRLGRAREKPEGLCTSLCLWAWPPWSWLSLLLDRAAVTPASEDPTPPTSLSAHPSLGCLTSPVWLLSLYVHHQESQSSALSAPV